ncbi:DUF2062 domain-containing protein [Ferrimonas pelagia]|uniref:DUF2062 domain-containing protein n=2 Tax=Ferrimonas pelagia TaxID=1177826 RepID=A0ABP9FBM7_9GAMM
MKRIMPDPEAVRQHKYLKIFGPWMQRANIWHLNRRSASGALAIGMFTAWLPIPMQMVFAALLAIIAGVNMPLAIATVWISNPLTMPIMFYTAYLMGTWVLDHERLVFHFELSLQWFHDSVNTIGPPFLLGCVLMGLICAALTYLVINSLWRYSILFSWKKRKERRRFPRPQ